jgi:predicted DNA-binding protein
MPSLPPHPRHRRYSLRWQARLDAETHTKLQELVQAFRRNQSQVLRHVMQWGLAYTQRWTIGPSIPDRPHLVHMLMDPELGQQVQDTAAAHGVSIAAWVRQAMRQVTPEDFPPSWHAGDSAIRAHESGYFRRKLGLWLDEETARKLAVLSEVLGRSAAEVVRQLIGQAAPEDFPESWQMAVEERRARDARRAP